MLRGSPERNKTTSWSRSFHRTLGSGERLTRLHSSIGPFVCLCMGRDEPANTREADLHPTAIQSPLQRHGRGAGQTSDRDRRTHPRLGVLLVLASHVHSSCAEVLQQAELPVEAGLFLTPKVVRVPVGESPAVGRPLVLDKDLAELQVPASTPERRIDHNGAVPAASKRATPGAPACIPSPGDSSFAISSNLTGDSSIAPQARARCSPVASQGRYDQDLRRRA